VLFDVDRDFVKKLALALIISVWAIVGIVLVAPIVNSHSIAWSSRLPSSIFGTTSPSTHNNKWRLMHVVTKGCKCSDTVVKYLLKRGPSTKHDDFVIVVGPADDWTASLTAAGFATRTATKEDTKGVHALPFLQIVNSSDQSLYVGGYGRHFIRRDSDIKDMEIIANLENGKPTTEFPIFGCAASSIYRKFLDPLNFKSNTDQTRKL